MGWYGIYWGFLSSRFNWYNSWIHGTWLGVLTYTLFGVVTYGVISNLENQTNQMYIYTYIYISYIIKFIRSSQNTFERVTSFDFFLNYMTHMIHFMQQKSTDFAKKTVGVFPFLHDYYRLPTFSPSKSINNKYPYRSNHLVRGWLGSTITSETKGI